MKNKITFKGWEPGMRKVSFTKLLHEKGELTLKDAKSITDRLLDNDDETITLEFKDENTTKAIYEQSRELGVICEWHT